MMRGTGFDKDSSLAVNKDVYIPAGSKWVRYGKNGHMVKSEDYRKRWLVLLRQDHRRYAEGAGLDS